MGKQNRRSFLKNISLAGSLALLPTWASKGQTSQMGSGHAANTGRKYWISIAEALAEPVLTHLANNTLKANMPIETTPNNDWGRQHYAHLEAFGRLMVGLAPWLECTKTDAQEAKKQQKWRNLFYEGLNNATNPQAADYMNFDQHGAQPLVDAAFLAQAFLRAPKQLWQPLPNKVKQQTIDALILTRKITPYYNNWLLFSAIIEAFFASIDAPYDAMRVELSLKTLNQWYLGDGNYGDGPHYHHDYYNSFVIHPMLHSIIEVFAQHSRLSQALLASQHMQRMVRYAAQQERIISPEGTFPPVGRSLPYRFGAFQVLALVALLQKLPPPSMAGGVRTALATVMHRMMQASDMFDQNGWLKLGFYGSQPNIAEKYLNTGSLYLCSAVLLPLGLPPTAPFWAQPNADWVGKRIWQGEDLPADHALKQ